VAGVAAGLSGPADLDEGVNPFENDPEFTTWAAETDHRIPSEDTGGSESGAGESGESPPAAGADVPAEVEDVLKYIDEHDGSPLPGYKVGTDGTARYTADHYETFTRIR
jgi:hypothetical protein